MKLTDIRFTVKDNYRNYSMTALPCYIKHMAIAYKQYELAGGTMTLEKIIGTDRYNYMTAYSLEFLQGGQETVETETETVEAVETVETIKEEKDVLTMKTGKKAIKRGTATIGAEVNKGKKVKIKSYCLLVGGIHVYFSSMSVDKYSKNISLYSGKKLVTFLVNGFDTLKHDFISDSGTHFFRVYNYKNK